MNKQQARKHALNYCTEILGAIEQVAVAEDFGDDLFHPDCVKVMAEIDSITESLAAKARRIR